MVLLEIFAGVLLFLAVSAISIRTDIASTETKLSDTVTYIKEQCNNNLKLDIASESKSLMRMVESAELLKLEFTEHGATDEKTLENYATLGYLTGILLLDEYGTVETSYGSDALDPAVLFEQIDPESLL